MNHNSANILTSKVPYNSTNQGTGHPLHPDANLNQLNPPIIEVSRISIKISPLWRKNIKIWKMQVDAQSIKSMSSNSEITSELTKSIKYFNRS